MRCWLAWTARPPVEVTSSSTLLDGGHRRGGRLRVDMGAPFGQRLERRRLQDLADGRAARHVEEEEAELGVACVVSVRSSVVDGAALRP
jgi:hypothetical protein